MGTFKNTMFFQLSIFLFISINFIDFVSAVMSRGECVVAEGHYRKPPFDKDYLVGELEQFLPMYRARPSDMGRERGGALIDHSFAIWTLLRWIKPRYIVESGVFHGWTTYLSRKAVPDAKIISIDPNDAHRFREDPNVQFFTGSNFVDFTELDWNNLIPNAEDRCEKTVIFFDDHQSGILRAAQAQFRGFCQFIYDDNYPINTGDNFSFKQACAGNGDAEQTSFMTDFKRGTWTRAGVNLGLVWDALRNGLDMYYEFPPIAVPALTKQTRYIVTDTTTPLLDENDEAWTRLSLSEFNGDPHLANLFLGSLNFYNSYVHINYVRLKKDQRFLPIETK